MPGADKNFNARVITLKSETVEGQDSGPTVLADALKVLNYTPQFMDADQKVRRIDKAYYGADPVAMAAFKRGATFSMEVHGGGTAAGTAVPPWMRVLQYCGYGAPVVGANSVVQKPTTANIGSATHWGWIDDLLLKAIGMRGSVGFVWEDDEFPLLNFNMLGRPPQSLADQVAPGVPTIAGYIEPVLAATENTTILYGNYAYGVRRLSMTDGATLQLRSLINPQDRITYSARNWTGELVIEIGDISVVGANPFVGIREGMTRAAQIVQGTIPGNIVQCDMPKLQVTGNVALSEEQGKVMGTFPVSALPAAGNDEVVFTTK